MAELVKRPRPFSLAAGVAFMVVGVAAIVAAFEPEVRVGAVVALSLLFGGVAELVALATRRAPAPEVEQD